MWFRCFNTFFVLRFINIRVKLWIVWIERSRLWYLIVLRFIWWKLTSWNTAFFLLSHRPTFDQWWLSHLRTTLFHRFNCFGVSHLTNLTPQRIFISRWVYCYFWWIDIRNSRMRNVRLLNWHKLTSDRLQTLGIVIGTFNRGYLIFGKVVFAFIYFRLWLVSYFWLLIFLILAQNFIIKLYKIESFAGFGYILFVILNQLWRSSSWLPDSGFSLILILL